MAVRLGLNGLVPQTFEWEVRQVASVLAGERLGERGRVDAAGVL